MDVLWVVVYNENFLGGSLGRLRLLMYVVVVYRSGCVWRWLHEVVVACGGCKGTPHALQR